MFTVDLSSLDAALENLYWVLEFLSRFFAFGLIPS